MIKKLVDHSTKMLPHFVAKRNSRMGCHFDLEKSARKRKTGLAFGSLGRPCPLQGTFLAKGEESSGWRFSVLS